MTTWQQHAIRPGPPALPRPGPPLAQWPPGAGGVPEWVPEALHRAEVLWVAQVARDGGIEPWREQALARVRVARVAAAAGRLARAETAALVVAVLDEQIRDGCCGLVELDPDPGWTGLWRHLAVHAVPPWRAEPHFVLAWAAWLAGDAALARQAVDVVRADEPAHPAARLLDRALATGVPPRLRARPCA